MGGDSGGGLFDASVQVERTLILDAITMEAGLANWLGACVAVVDYWPIREGEPGGGKPLYMAVEESERAGAGVTSLRKVSPRLLSASATPVSVLEVMIKFDHREVYSWSDVCALFSPDADERTPSDILLAGLQPLPPPVYDSTLPPPPGDALELAPSTATALMAITGRGGSSSGGGGGSRPGSARSHSRGPVATESAAIVESHGGKFFNIAGGARSDLSVRNSALRTSQTKLTHTYLHTLDAKMAVIAAGGGGPTPLPSASASSSSSRPGSASASSRGARPSSAASAYSVGALG